MIRWLLAGADLTTDAAARAGNDRNLALEQSCHVSSSKDPECAFVVGCGVPGAAQAGAEGAAKEPAICVPKGPAKSRYSGLSAQLREHQRIGGKRQWRRSIEGEVRERVDIVARMRVARDDAPREPDAHGLPRAIMKI